MSAIPSSSGANASLPEWRRTGALEALLAPANAAASLSSALASLAGRTKLQAPRGNHLRGFSIDIGAAAAAAAAASAAVAAVLRSPAGPLGGVAAPTAEATAAATAVPASPSTSAAAAALPLALEVDWMWPSCLPAGQAAVEVAVHMSPVQPSRGSGKAPGGASVASAEQGASAKGPPGGSELPLPPPPPVLHVCYLGQLIHSQPVAGAGSTLVRFNLPGSPSGDDVMALTLMLVADGVAGPAQPVLVMPSDAAQEFWGLFSELVEEELRPAAEVAAARGMRHAPYVSVVFSANGSAGGAGGTSSSGGSGDARSHRQPHPPRGGGGASASARPPGSSSLLSQQLRQQTAGIDPECSSGDSSASNRSSGCHSNCSDTQASSAASEPGVDLAGGGGGGAIPPSTRHLLDRCTLLVHNALLEARERDARVQLPGVPAGGVLARWDGLGLWERGTPLGCTCGATSALHRVAEAVPRRPCIRHSIDVLPSAGGLTSGGRGSGNLGSGGIGSGGIGGYLSTGQLRGSGRGDVSAKRLGAAFAEAWRYMSLITLDVEYLLLAVPAAFEGSALHWDERLFIGRLRQVGGWRSARARSQGYECSVPSVPTGSVPTACCGAARRPRCPTHQLPARLPPLCSQVIDLLQQRGMWSALARLLRHCSCNGLCVLEDSRQVASTAINVAFVRALYQGPRSGVRRTSLTGPSASEPPAAAVPVLATAASLAAVGSLTSGAPQVALGRDSVVSSCSIASSVTQEGLAAGVAASADAVVGRQLSLASDAATGGAASPTAAVARSTMSLASPKAAQQAGAAQALGSSRASRLVERASAVMFALVVCYCLVFLPLLAPSLQRAARGQQDAGPWLLAPAVIVHCILNDAVPVKQGWVLWTHCATAATASALAAWGLVSYCISVFGA